MGLTEAIHEVANGHAIVSNKGRIYTQEMIASIWVSNRCASFTAAGMTVSERKGEWRIANE